MCGSAGWKSYRGCAEHNAYEYVNTNMRTECFKGLHDSPVVIKNLEESSKDGLSIEELLNVDEAEIENF